MKLHHIGYVVKDIEQYEQHLLFRSKINSVFDPIQNASLCLYETWSDTYIELIEPKDETAFTFPFLKKNGNSYHHLCYRVENENVMLEVAKKYQLLMFKGPIPAPLFGDQMVYFFFDKNKSITEFLIEP